VLVFNRDLGFLLKSLFLSGDVVNEKSVQSYPEMNFQAIMCRPYGTFLSRRDNLVIDRQFIAGNR